MPNVKVVYLSGGTHTDWRERVKKECPGHIYLDPTQHGLEDPKDYAPWCLAGIEKADIVFAYLEATNPRGFNTCFELGVAHASGCGVIVVDEKFHDDARMLSLLRATVPVFRTLEEAISMLKEDLGR